ncbi:MAG: hypothetical protein JST38_13040 [Bacteroidetes bacterium]|nr:hypothetical protein [Bacteroidota bacterium]MBS1941793.1 hypothetical protein [Bacteroidota bacterium]
MAHLFQRLTAATFLLMAGLLPNKPAMAVAPPDAPADFLALTAWMSSADGNVGNVLVEVDVNGVKDWGRPDADGRIDLLLPADAEAVIHFSKPGHLTKTVTVDTHNMQQGSFRGKRRAVSFGVELVPEAGSATAATPGAVGAIAFTPTSGALLVQGGQHTMPARRQKVEF